MFINNVIKLVGCRTIQHRLPYALFESDILNEIHSDLTYVFVFIYYILGSIFPED